MPTIRTSSSTICATAGYTLSLSMGTFWCIIIFPCYLALKQSFLEKQHILFKTRSMNSLFKSPETWIWQLGHAKICWYFNPREDIIRLSYFILFLCNNEMILFICGYSQRGKKAPHLQEALYHHISPELCVHVNKPSHLCLLQSTWPQSDGPLESSSCADWQWEQPGQRPESSGASWPSHTMWSWLITQNRCPLKQQTIT